MSVECGFIEHSLLLIIPHKYEYCSNTINIYSHSDLFTIACFARIQFACLSKNADYH